MSGRWCDDPNYLHGKVRTRGGGGRWGNPGLGDKVIAPLTDARADHIEVAIDKTGFGYVDVFINNLEQRS